MRTRSAKLCLNMIVKNEAGNIERCLRSVAEHVACWVIADTGSTDGTQDLVRGFFAKRRVPGELHAFPFVTFDQARNRALDLARASPLRFDYILFADADMELTVSDRNFARRLAADVYMVRQDSGIAYWNARLLKRDAAARYVGVTHEYLDLKGGSTADLDGISFIDHASGANRPGKFARDAALLSRALDTEGDPGLRARYTFYLANSLRDDGDHAGALARYGERAAMGGWQEEIFVSLLNAAQMKAALGHAANEVIAAFEAARDSLSARAPEALHGGARYCREHGLHERGYRLAAPGRDVPAPRAGLFVAEWVYRYGLLDEFAIAAYWSDRFAESLAACDRLLAEPSLPEGDRGRVAKNRQFALDRLRESPPPRRAAGAGASDLLKYARRREELGWPHEHVLSTYDWARRADPTRVEPLHGAARLCRRSGLHERGYALAVEAERLLPAGTPPAEEAWIHRYGLLDELTTLAFRTRRFGECRDRCERLLKVPDVPADVRDRAVEHRDGSRRELERGGAPRPAIPGLLHFIIGLDDARDSKPLSLVHYLAVRSALSSNEGFEARVYFHHEPHGPYWDLVRRIATCIHVEVPTEVFGRPVALFAHRADVLRMRLLIEHGGIYLDFDTICQRPFAPLLDGQVVLGREELPAEGGGRRPVGLCNATIIAPPQAEFMRLWYDSYRDFVGGPSGSLWNRFSVQVPMELAARHPHLVKIEPAASFFWPSWTEEGVDDMFRRDLDFRDAYCFHLWQSKSARYIERLTVDSIREEDTTYNRIARRFLAGPEPLA